jgi:hypothetical protein
MLSGIYDDGAGSSSEKHLQTNADGHLKIEVYGSALPAGAATEAKQDAQIALDGAAGDAAPALAANASGKIGWLRKIVDVLSGILSVKFDQTTPGTTDSVTVKASEGIGSLTEAAPASDTASSGLNGRLQRIAQNLTTFFGAAGDSAPALATNATGVIGWLRGLYEKSVGHTASVTITRPANIDAYTAGDAVGDTGGSAILEFANMGASGGNILITSAELEIDVSAVPIGMTGFKLRLYNLAPTAIADNAAWDLVSGDRTKYLGSISLTQPTDMGSTLVSENDGINKQIKLSGTSVFGILTTDGGYTPTSAAVKKITVHTMDL